MAMLELTTPGVGVADLAWISKVERRWGAIEYLRE